MTTTVLQTFQFFWCPQYEDRIRLSCATAMPTLWRRKDGKAEQETEDNTWLLTHMLSLCLVLSQIASPRFSSSFWVTFTIFHDYLCPHVQTVSHTKFMNLWGSTRPLTHLLSQEKKSNWECLRKLTQGSRTGGDCSVCIYSLSTMYIYNTLSLVQHQAHSLSLFERSSSRLDISSELR